MKIENYVDGGKGYAYGVQGFIPRRNGVVSGNLEIGSIES